MSEPERLLVRLSRRAWKGEPGRPTASVLRLCRLLGPIVDLVYRSRMIGWENLPDRPCLVVANHSGCGQAEVYCLVRRLLEREPRPPITAMAHPLAFYFPGVAAFMRGLGAIPSSYEDATAAFASGCSVIVFPGGDHEAFRPIWQAYQVDWNGRLGFLKLARKAGVPIVPLGIAGSHFTSPILWRSRLLPWLLVYPRLLGVRCLPVTLQWVAGAIALALAGPSVLTLHQTALAVAAWCFLPLASFLPVVPWRIRFSLGPAVSPGEPGTPLDESYALVTARVQAEVDRARSI